MLPQPPPDTDDPFELLMACHARIRRHAALVRRLALDADATTAHVQDAAERAHRYFSEALPLHAADEDESLAPRAAADPELRQGFEALAEQHREIHRALADVLPTLGHLAEHPEAPRAALGAPGPRLAELLEAHLAFEERALFPGLRALLTLAARSEIAHEMRARRALP